MPSSTFRSLLSAASASATPPSPPLGRRRPRSRLAATAIAALALSSWGDRSSSSVLAHTGLRGNHLLERHQEVELDAASGSVGRMPQHGQQRPRRPRDLPPHMLPPPGRVGRHRRLFEETFASNLLTRPDERGLLDAGGRGGRGGAGAGRVKQATSYWTNTPNDVKEARASMIEARAKKKQKIKGENDKRKEENKKIKDRLKNTKKQKPDNNGSRAQNKKKQKPDGRKDDDKKDKDRPDKKDKKDKNKPDKKDKDKPDKDGGNKPNKNKPMQLKGNLDGGAKNKKKDKDKNKDKVDKKDKEDNDKPNKKDNGKPNKKDKDKPDKKDKDKPDKKDKDKPDKKDKDKPDKKDKPNSNGQKPGKKPKPGNMNANKPQKDKPINSFTAIKPLNDKPGKNDYDPMTDGKFNTDSYVPPKEDNKPASNNSGGGGSFSSFVKPVQQSEPATTTPPTPRPTRTPRPTKGPKPQPNGAGTQQVISGGASTPPPTPRPTRTPRPTKGPKPQPTDAGTQQELSGGASIIGDYSPFNVVSSRPPTPRPTRRPKGKPQPVPAMNVVSTRPPTPRPTRRPKGKPQPVPVMDDASNFVSSGGDSPTSKWNFVPSLTDRSSQLDSFEKPSGLNWRMGSVDPWEPSSTDAYYGGRSITSGISSRIYSNMAGVPVYSNLTLVTDGNFQGGVLTFRVKANSLTLPNEAFFVMVDGNVELPPDVAARRLNGDVDWVEFSVAVGAGERWVTWVHVYNPFGLRSLPQPEVDLDDVGLWMDDLRHAPFDTHISLDVYQLEKTTGRGGADPWRVSSDGDTVIASSSSSIGHADVEFALYSPRGGTLVYNVKTSTTGPIDDFAVIFNDGETPADAIFGDMLGFERRTIEVPGGKVKVTMRHRSNPGGYDSSMLKSLGEAGTDGKTWLQDVSFRAN